MAKKNIPGRRTARDIMDAVDPLCDTTPADLFYYTTFALIEYEAKRRGAGDVGIAVGIYEGGQHRFLFDAEVAEVIDLAKLRADLATAGPEPEKLDRGAPVGAVLYAGKFGDYLRRRGGLRDILKITANTVTAPAFICLPGEPMAEANEGLVFGDGFPLPADFRKEFYRDIAAPIGETVPPVDIRLPGDVMLLVTGRAPALARAKRLTRRGKKGIKSPEYKAAKAANLPLVTPEISDAGLVMLLYKIAETGLIIKGEAGVYEGGDWLYTSRHEFYEVIGANLDYRTRRKGLADLTRQREKIAGYLRGRYAEYKSRGGILTKIIHVDRDEVRFKGDKKYIGFQWQPLYTGLIREALTRSTGVKGGVIFMPTGRLDALLTEAQKVGDKNYAGLALGFIDVLRNRKKDKYIRNLDVLLEILKMAGYRGDRQSLPQALDALKAKLELYGASDIIADYDIQGDKVLITPHPALGRGETGDLFDAS